MGKIMRLSMRCDLFKISSIDYIWSLGFITLIMELCAISGARCIRKMSSCCSMRPWPRRWPPLKIRGHLDQPGDEPMGFWLRNEIGMLE